MKGNIRLGLDRFMIPVPPWIWTRLIVRSAQQAAASLGFMTANHHRVRDYTVREMPGRTNSIPPESIAADLGLNLERVIELLDQLETRLTFLYRGDGVNVSWAYPMTTDHTPHQITFDDGVQVQAA